MVIVEKTESTLSKGAHENKLSIFKYVSSSSLPQFMEMLLRFKKFLFLMEVIKYKAQNI